MTTSTKICYTKPSITELEVRYALDAAENGWGKHCYDYIRRLEALFKAHLGVKHAIATSSCTGALHMGLSALGIGPGDEVILADTNWIATAAPITYLGAVPIFIDIMPETWCIDPNLAEKAVTPRTKAIIATHLYGNLCPMERLLTLGKQYNIPIIEDAAEAIGSTFHGQRAGSMGLFSVFSFHGTKTVTTGEGGMFVTDDDALYERVLTLSNHGRSSTQSREFWPDMIGFKYKMSNIQAAIGCAQMERIETLIARKRDIFYYYREQLQGIASTTFNTEEQGTTNGFWMPTIVFSRESGVTREALKKAFAVEDIDARVFFWPLSSLPSFGGGLGSPVAREIASRAINLPSFHDMTPSQQGKVVMVIKTLIEESNVNT